MKAETQLLRRRVPTVLVATPGRLNDHLENSGLAVLCANLRVLVFDEADQLLDMGFKPAIEKMLRMLPHKDTRQTLLYSATFPKQVDEISKLALRMDGKNSLHTMVDTIGNDELPTHKIPQSYMVTSIEEQLPAVMSLLAAQEKVPNHKIIVFLTTARQTSLFAAVFNELKKMRVFKNDCFEIHSRKSQSQRTKCSEIFRTTTQGILFSSDVSARGMDYPDVSMVVQVGLPSDKAQYVHRLGRTARAGKSGIGMLMLADFETHFMKQIKDLPVIKANLKQSEVDTMRPNVERATDQAHRADASLGGQAYQAWLGFYNSHLRVLGWNKEALVQHANYYATNVLRLYEIPALEAKTVGKMGMKGVPGLRVEKGPAGGGNQKGNGRGNQNQKRTW